MPAVFGAIDLQKNELRQAVVQNLPTGSAPTSPVKGQLWFDSTVNVLKWYNGTVWVDAQDVPPTASATVSTQAIGDSAAAGVATAFSRGDHKHAMPGFGTSTAQTTNGAAKSDGVSTSIARSDHTHGTPALTSVSPQYQGIPSVAAVGTGTAAAREDHVHAMPGFGAPTQQTSFNATSDSGTSTNLARADHAHGTPSHTWSDHSSIRLDQLAGPATDLNFNGSRITSLGNPLTSGDAANKDYVDNLVAGMSWKAPVRLATTANITMNSLAAIDGVTPVQNDRILVKNQTVPSQNGIYTAQAATWNRANDANLAAEMVNAAVFVSEGTTQADTAWVQTVNAPITMGTTGLTFVQFTGAGTYSNGNGLTLTGNVFAIDDSVVATDAQVTTAVGVKADKTTSIIAGNGLTGGGDLSASRTLNVVAGDTTLTVAATSVVVNTAVIATRAYADATVPAGMAKKYAAALTGTSSPETITHNLNTRDIQLQVLNGATPYTAVEVDWDATTVNTAVVRFSPNLGAGYRVVVMG